MQTQNMGLLFIPDISGFTRFIHETDIKHSQLIIQELLETIIRSNELGLEISEVEGDAILFYKFGQAPDLATLYRQVEKMFRMFHKALVAYNQQKLCQCKACLAAASLSLKIISHYGEFTNYNVQNFKKLIGKDVITAHQLLKNDIQHHEYWLVTQTLLPEPEEETSFGQLLWNRSHKQLEEGPLRFQYTHLSHLKNDLHPDPLPSLQLDGKTKIIGVSAEYESDLIKTFHVTGNWEYRTRWKEDVRNVEEVSHYLPRVGMKCRIIRDDGEETISIKSFSFDEEKIQFAEINEDNDDTTVFTFDVVDHDHTRVTIEHYVNDERCSTELFQRQIQPKLETSFQKSMVNLERLLSVVNYSYPM